MTASLTVITANLRRRLPEDRGRLAWSKRRVRLVQLLRKHNPDVLLAQECDEGMVEYVEAKLGLVAYKPTPGNRVVFYRAILDVADKAHTDLGERSFAVAVKLALPGQPDTARWYVTLHLNPADDKLRQRQAEALGRWLDQLGGPVVVGGDFSTEGRIYSKLADARRLVPVVGGEALATRHGWYRKRRPGPWVDRLLVTPGSRVRWVSLILTDDQESDHHFPAMAIEVGR